MKQIFYVMQFKGGAEQISENPLRMRARSRASSCTLTTMLGVSGISSSTAAIPGAQAQFESQVTITGDKSFVESGTIHFGKGDHWLTFSTVGQGYLAPSADPKLQHGTVTWKVERGEGQFACASGLITSNFTISDAGVVNDNHLGVIFIP